VNQEEVESQLSAMFDGELRSAECELLSRRLDRDEELRARWSRYAVMGAVLRSEPVTAVRGDFSQRVSAALAGELKSAGASKTVSAWRRSGRKFWNASLAASLVAAVAGGSILMLRNVSDIPTLQWASARAGSAALASNPAAAAAAVASVSDASSIEPLSYVTPSVSSRPSYGLRAQLANYVVAHSEYSAPLMRRNLLSALVTEEEAVDDGAVQNGVGAAQTGAVQKSNATTAIEAPHGGR